MENTQFVNICYGYPLSHYVELRSSIVDYEIYHYFEHCATNRTIKIHIPTNHTFSLNVPKQGVLKGILAFNDSVLVLQ